MAMQTDDDQRARLRAVGLRATAPRVAVLRCLAEQDRPLTHAEIMAALGTDWDRATVYRNLADLTRAELLRRYAVGDQVWRFESAHGHDHTGPGHAHFVCVECGDVKCIDDVKVQVPRSPSVPQAVRAPDLEIQLKGRCDDCV